MAYTSDRTGANIDQVLDNADAGNIGKSTTASVDDAHSDFGVSGFFSLNFGGVNNPTTQSYYGIQNIGATPDRGFQLVVGRDTNEIYFERQKDGVYQGWQEIYHTGNTGFTSYASGGVTPGAQDIKFRTDFPKIEMSDNIVSANALIRFNNPNGEVGGITTSGTTTAYNTSSDPRLKSKFTMPDSGESWAEFDKIYGAFGKFTFNADPDTEVWGFNAHTLIDADGLENIASEGEGDRNLTIGEVYETIPAEVDDDGNETTPAIEKTVSPAGVDQAKIVPYLVAVIQDLRQRIEALES